MDKKLNASQLLRALGDVDDIYINESMSELNEPVKLNSRKSKAKVTKIMSIAAAAAVLLISSYILLRVFVLDKASSTRTAEAPAVNAEYEYVDDLDMNSPAEDRGGINTASEDSTLDAGVEEEDIMSVDGVVPPEADASGNTYSFSAVPSNTDIVTAIASYDSLDQMNQAQSVQLSVPESVGDSESMSFFSYNLGIVEVRYLDAEENVVCTIRKAPGEFFDISGSDDACVSNVLKVDVEGAGHVRLEGDIEHITSAVWICGGNSYSITCEPMSLDDITALIGEVN